VRQARNLLRDRHTAGDVAAGVVGASGGSVRGAVAAVSTAPGGKVPDRIAVALVEFMTVRLVENPRRIGKPLIGCR
jgi:hypothetical protein